MTTCEELIAKVRAYDPDAPFDLITKAYAFSEKAHAPQQRESGEPYFLHPVAVACILTEMKLDVASIITALLHDTVEDTDITLEDIEREFTPEISKLVDGVTKLTKIEHQSDHIRQAENFRKLLLAMSEDIRVLLVKLADRVHNMRTLIHVRSPEKRVRTAHETMEIFAPLAERIGIQKIKNELQDLAFAELHPEARSSIVKRLDYLRNAGLIKVDSIVDHIQQTLTEAGVKALVTGREKTPCSIWQKMERKNISFEQLSDIVAFRVLVDTVPECYQVLGAIHSQYHMVPESFKDFISTPKDNAYQSLHTVVIGPEQQRIEIQIRTHEMHEIAELGVAAHWVYKQGSSDKREGKQYRWVRELLNILEQASEPEDFLENTKLEMYYDQVFCFTPKGKLIVLPRGATPVDFAYTVHSNIGNTCVGAKINGRIVPLSTQLKNGDQVEIIRSKTQVPSPAWEKFIVTGKARSEVRRFIRMQQRQEYLNLGRAILAKSLRQEGKELNEKQLQPLLEIFRRKTIDDLLAAIGEGVISRNEVLRALNPTNAKTLKERFSFLKFRKAPPPKEEDKVSIKGLIPGMAVHFAPCCHPLPGDRIVGIVQSGKGIAIHTVDCEVLENFTNTPERWIDISWERDPNQEMHIGRIKTVLSHEIGALATITTVIAKEKGNVNNLKILNRSVDFFELIIDIEVRGAQHLSNIIASLRAQTCVHSVERYKV